ncbi:MAG: hypothetical protein Q8R69_09480 [Telluria sp.]|nr:hypothetical protein [Telluria sp.]
MAVLTDTKITSRDNIARLEAERLLARRLPERCVLDVFRDAGGRGR